MPGHLHAGGTALMNLELYIKTWCPWCHSAVDELNRLGHSYTVHDIEADIAAAKDMLSFSRQSRVPTLRAGEHVLADFGPEELAPFFKKHGIQAPVK
jgi:glutaredoxin